MENLSGSKYGLLLALVNDTHRQSNKVFDKHDNCFQLGQRHIARVTGKSRSSVNRLFVAMRSKDLIRNVIDCSGAERVMLNPAFIWCKPSKYKKWYALAMYHQGSDKKASEWAYQCKRLGILWDYKVFGEVIDIETGEVTYGSGLRTLSDFELYQWNKERDKETCWDRTKRRA